MPIRQPRYSVSSPVPGGVVPSGTEEVANAAMGLAQTIGKVADKTAIELGVPAAQDKGAVDGTQLSWRRIPATGEIARAYNAAAVDTHNRVIEKSIEDTGDRLANSLKGDVESYKKFPELFRKGTNELIAAIPAEQRQRVAAARDEAMASYVSKLQVAAGDIAIEQVGATQAAMLDDLHDKLVQASADGDAAKVSKYSNSIHAILGTAVGQAYTVGADGKERAVSVDEIKKMQFNDDGTPKLGPDGAPVNALEANKVQFKTQPTIKLAEAFKYLSKVESEVKQSAVLGQFRRELDAGRGAQYALSFRKDSAQSAGIDYETREKITNRMMREVRAYNSAEDRAGKQLDKDAERNYKTRVAMAVYKLENPAEGSLTQDELNYLKENAAFAPEDFRVFSSKLSANMAFYDDPGAVKSLDELLKGYDTVGASEALDGFAREKKVTGATFDLYSRRIRETDQEVQQGPLSSPRVKQIIDAHEATLGASLAADPRMTRSGQRKAVKLVQYWTSRARQAVAYEAAGTNNPAEWAKIAETTTRWFQDNLGSFAVMQSFRQLDAGQSGTDALSLPIPPNATPFLADVAGKKVFNTSAYIADLYERFSKVGKGCTDPANLTTCGEAALAAEEWERVQSTNPEVGQFLKAEAERIKREREARAAAKTVTVP